MSLTTVHLLRHGEVENPDNVIYERLPGFHLSARGKKMAERTAEFISTHDELSKIGHIISSPLERTLETAKPTSEALGGTPIVVDDRLIESRNFFAGKNIQSETREMLKHFHFIKFWKTFGHPAKPSWGEPYAEQSARMTSIIKEVWKKYSGEQVLLVSHQAPIWIARLTAEERPLRHSPQSRVCALASITSLVFDNEAEELAEVKYRTPAADI